MTATSRFIVRAEQAISEIREDLDERRAGESEDETLEDIASDVLVGLGRLEATAGGVCAVTLFEAATELRIRLRSASEADAQDELMSRGRTVRGDIVSAAEHLEAVQSYRVTIGRTDAPMLDTRAIRQAIGRFSRGTLQERAQGATAAVGSHASRRLDYTEQACRPLGQVNLERELRRHRGVAGACGFG